MGEEEAEIPVFAYARANFECWCDEVKVGSEHSAAEVTEKAFLEVLLHTNVHREKERGVRRLAGVVQQPRPVCTLVNDLLGVVHRQQQARANIYLRPPADKVAALRCSLPEHSRGLHYFVPSPLPFARPSRCYTELIIDGIIKTARQVTSLDSFASTFINK